MVTQFEEEIDGIDSNLKTLKSNICSVTGDDFNIGWGTMLEHLREKHDETMKRLKDTTAEVIGKIAVVNVLSSIKQFFSGKRLIVI